MGFRPKGHSLGTQQDGPVNEKSGAQIRLSLDANPEAFLTGINERALLRKLDFKLLPALTLLYLLSFLDRSNGKVTKSPFLALIDWFA